MTFENSVQVGSRGVGNAQSSSRAIPSQVSGCGKEEGIRLFCTPLLKHCKLVYSRSLLPRSCSLLFLCTSYHFL
jgi:hypothetical protein